MRVVVIVEQSVFGMLDTGELLKTIDTEADTIDAMAFSPDGKTLASTDNNGDGNIRFWDVATGEFLKTITVEAGRVFCRVFAGWEKHWRVVVLTTLASGDLGEVSIWDVATGKTFENLYWAYRSRLFCRLFS